MSFFKPWFGYLCTVLICLAPSLTNAEGSPDLLGNDFIGADDHVSITSFGVDDVFTLGQTVTLVTPITGTAHLLATEVNVDATVEQSIYAAGDQVSIGAGIGEDALVIGKSIVIDAQIEGDLRGAATHLEVNAPIGGDLQFAGDLIKLNSTVAGTAAFATENLVFGPGARIDGDLILYGEASKDFIIAASVITPDRIIFRATSQIVDQEFVEPVGEHMGALGLGVFYELLAAALLTSLIVMTAKGFTENAYGRAWQSVMASIGYGFLGLSLLSGSVLITALTLIGIPLSLLLVVATVLVAVVGYWMGSYFIGARIWLAARGELPSAMPATLLTVLLGVLCAALLSAIPFLGWWLTIAISLFGVGAISPWRGRRAGS